MPCVKSGINLKALSNDEIKVNLYNETDFREITKHIREINKELTDKPNNQLHGISYHTYLPINANAEKP